MLNQSSTNLEANDLPHSNSNHLNLLSEKIWGIHWNEHFPYKINDDDITAHHSSFEEFGAFAADNFSRIFENDKYPTSFLWLEHSPFKMRYYKEVGDFFIFKHGNKTIGGFVGNPIDWSSYYVRSFALLPEYEGRHIVFLFLKHFFKILEFHGIERVEADTSPSNTTIIQLTSRLRFNIAGTLLSERWGALTHLVKFFSKKHETVFLQQFCAGVRPQLR